MKAAAAIILALAVSAPARACAQDAGTVLDGIDRGDFQWKFYVAGLEHGIWWMNLGHPGPPGREYCMPLELALTNVQVISFLRDAVKRNPELLRAPAASVLLSELKRVFPCK